MVGSSKVSSPNNARLMWLQEIPNRGMADNPIGVVRLKLVLDADGQHPWEQA
jgi:hypothetical protein